MLNIDPDETLRACNPIRFKTYLVWRVENSKIKNESSIMTYWKALSMVYSQKAAGWIQENILYDIRNVNIPAQSLFWEGRGLVR